MTRKKKLSYHFLIVALIFFYIWYCRLPDINSCSKYELISMASVGEEKAELIIQNRPYKSYYEILELKGIGEKTIEVLKKKTKLKLWKASNSTCFFYFIRVYFY